MNRERLQQYLLDAVGSVVPVHGGAYVAGPLATGKRYYELVASGQHDVASTIRSENEGKMKAFVAALRTRLSYPVIDPGLIKISEWTPTDIGDFYITVIQRFVKEIWFMDDWQYSRGASKEFQFAITTHIVCLDANGTTIPAEVGANMISDVAKHLVQLGIDASRFADRVTNIRQALLLRGN
jgi:hypothetical protein